MQPSNRPLRGTHQIRGTVRGAHGLPDGGAQLALMHATGPAVQVGVAEVLILHVGDEAVLVEVVELHGAQPCAQQAAGVLGREAHVGAHGALRARRLRAAAAGPS